MSGSLSPALLLSMPQLLDPNFSRTVVLLCKHGGEGAFGLVINRPLVTTGTVVVQLDPPVSTDRELSLWIGGPVEPERSWILLRSGAEDPEAALATPIGEGLYLSTSPHLLRKLLTPQPPANARLVVGYAGWGPGQLEQELAESSWLLSDVDADLVFNTPPDKMWEQAIRRLGADPATLAMSRGVH